MCKTSEEVSLLSSCRAVAPAHCFRCADRAVHWNLSIVERCVTTNSLFPVNIPGCAMLAPGVVDGERVRLRRVYKYSGDCVQHKDPSAIPTLCHRTKRARRLKPRTRFCSKLAMTSTSTQQATANMAVGKFAGHRGGRLSSV